MERHETSGSDLGGELQDLGDRGMTPSDPRLILGRRVLKVVDEQVGVAADVEARGPVGGPREIPTEGGLVVRQVGDDFVTVVYAKAEGRPRMADEVGGHFERSRSDKCPA